jgi:hypothetical protein
MGFATTHTARTKDLQITGGLQLEFLKIFTANNNFELCMPLVLFKHQFTEILKD